MNSQDLADYIKEYDSNTFNGSDLTDEQAKQIAELLILRFVEHELDGVQLSDAYETITEV